MDIKQEYREETNLDVYSEDTIYGGSGSFSDEYVKWLESKALNIQNVSNCENPHCEDGVTDEIYGEKIYCSNCENK